MRLFAVLALLASLAAAGESYTLTFRDGKKKTVELESIAPEGLVATQGGREFTIAWDELEPESAFEARTALTPYDDGAAQLELSGFALGLRLFPDAIERLEIALALGGLDEAAYAKRAKAITEAEIAYLTGHIDTLLAANAEPKLVLRAIKRLKERYPDHAVNRKYEPHIEALVERLAQEAEAEQDAQAKAKQDKALARLSKDLAKLDRKKTAAIEKGDALRKEAATAMEKRQVSRVRKKLVLPRGAERYYKKARDYLRDMVRLDEHFAILDKAAVQKEYEALAAKLVECYLGVARIQLTQRNYKGAIPYVRKVLIYDPIHEEALEMVEEIRENRIAFKLSDITNTGPIVNGG